LTVKIAGVSKYKYLKDLPQPMLYSDHIKQWYTLYN